MTFVTTILQTPVYIYILYIATKPMYVCWVTIIYNIRLNNTTWDKCTASVLYRQSVNIYPVMFLIHVVHPGKSLSEPTHMNLLRPDTCSPRKYMVIHAWICMKHNVWATCLSWSHLHSVIYLYALASLATMREMQMIMMCMHVHLQLGSRYILAHTDYDYMPIFVIIHIS